MDQVHAGRGNSRWKKKVSAISHKKGCVTASQFFSGVLLTLIPAAADSFLLAQVPNLDALI